MTETRPRPKLLIVDDEGQFRLALKRQLELRGYETFDAEDGPKALELARDLDPEVIILDLAMPGMDGMETLARLKKIRPRSPVIMLTGHNRTGLLEEADRAGLFCLLEKPCGLEEILNAIASAQASRRRPGIGGWFRRALGKGS